MSESTIQNHSFSGQKSWKQSLSPRPPMYHDVSNQHFFDFSPIQLQLS